MTVAAPKSRRPRHYRAADFMVSLIVPIGVTTSEMSKYIYDEVCSGNGCRSPEDPLFYLDRNAVKITVLKRPRA